MGRIDCGDGDGGEPARSPSGWSSFRQPHVRTLGRTWNGRVRLVDRDARSRRTRGKEAFERAAAGQPGERSRVRHVEATSTIQSGNRAFRQRGFLPHSVQSPKVNGSNVSTTNPLNSRVLRVATVKRCSRAVAAIIASSISVSDVRCLIRAHSRKAAASIGKTP